MKKFKSILVFCLTSLLTFAFVLAAGCATDEDNGDDGFVPPPAVTTTLLSIELDTSRVKKEYYVGDNFNSTNLVVSATTKRSDSDATTTRDVTASAKVDYSSFRRNNVGSYNINVSYTLGEITKEASYTVTVSDVELTLDLNGFTDIYLVNTELDNLDKITATAKTVSPGKDDVVEDVTDKLVWNTDAVDKTQEGEYAIVASYTTSNGITRTASINVSYIESKEGLNVTLADGVDQTITLSTTNRTASIDVSKIVVRKVDDWGKIIEGDSGLVTGYTTKLYKEDTLIPAPSSGTVYSNLSSGTYQIWVEKVSDTDSDYVLSGFALIYVVEDVSNLRHTGGTTTQLVGIDTITSTWTYQVTSSLGETIDLTADDVEVLIDPMTVGTRTVTVYYYYYNAAGAKKTLTCNVQYTVQMGNLSKDTNTYDFTKIPVKPDDNTPLTTADFVGVNSFLTVVDGGTVNYRGGQDDGIIEIKNDALQVVFKGVGTLTIKARSTGGSNLSTIGVKDEDGNYMNGRPTANSAGTANAMYFNEGMMFEITGSSKTDLPEIEFTITHPGTYTIFTSIMDTEGSIMYDRTARVYAIQKVDIYDAAETASNYALSRVGKITEINLYSEEV